MFVVRQEGLEPPPLGLEGRCSIQLSYCRVADNPRFYLIERARGPITGPRVILAVSGRLQTGCGCNMNQPRQNAPAIRQYTPKAASRPFPSKYRIRKRTLKYAAMPVRTPPRMASAS